MSSVPSANRFTARHRCPICGGHERLPKGEGVRCAGFLSSDGKYAHCSRPEFAGALEVHPGSQTYAHLLEGPCKCGVTHAERPMLSIVSTVPMREKHASRGTIVAAYDYVDEQGALLFQAVRYDPKSFNQRRPATEADRLRAQTDEKFAKKIVGEWTYTTEGVRLVPYHLPELLAAPRGHGVVICEGEKDVEAARALGLVATCNPMGAGKWRSEFNPYFRDRHVVVVADVDAAENREVGQNHARHVCEELTGIAASVLYLELPAHDFADWAALEGSDKKRFGQLVRAAKAAAAASRPQFKAWSIKELLAKEFPPVVWAVPGLIPQGLTLFAGDPKSGKSHLMLQICTAIACGGVVLGTIPVKQGPVLYVDLENGEEILKERAQALFSRGQDVPDDFHYVVEAPSLDDGLLGLIESWSLTHPRTRLIVLDTFEAIRPAEGSSKSTNAYRQDYKALRPLADLAKRLRIGIVVVHHLNKSGNRISTIDEIFSRFSGSYGLNASVDNLMALGADGGGMVLSTRGRRGQPVKKALRWDTVSDQWIDSGDPAEAKQSDTRRAILQVLEEAEGPLWPSEISTRSGLAPSTVRQRLFHMARAGEAAVEGQKYVLGHKTRKSRNAVTPPEEIDVTPPLRDEDEWEPPPEPPVTALRTHDPPVYSGGSTTVTRVTALRTDDTMPPIGVDPFLDDGWFNTPGAMPVGP